ncbi:MAG: WG repeat-containing protein [Bacteroidetes bacterium]|nr:WG repeat-containing protein [Bacteroidota bacterium]
MYRFSLILILVIGVHGLYAATYERFEENGKIGLRDEEGHVVLPPDFDGLGWSDGQFSVSGNITGYRQNGRWGLINLQHQFLTPAEFESITSAGGDRIIVSKLINPYTVKYGCLDLEGKMAIPLVYDDVDIHGLRAIVMMKNGKRYEYGLIDLNDRSVIPVRYQQIWPVGSLRYAVRNFDNKIALSSEEGKWITDFFIDHISDFQFDYAIVTDGWKHGIINREGELIVKPSYRAIRILPDNKAEVQQIPVWTLMDEKLNKVVSLEADELNYSGTGWNIMRISGRSGTCNDHLKMVLPLEYEQIGGLTNGKFTSKKGGRWGLERTDGSPVLPFSFDSLCVEGNYIRTRLVSSGISKWQLYDTLGIQKGRAYDFIGPYNGSFFPARLGEFWGGLDRYGEEKIACVYDSLLQIRGNHVVVMFKEHYGIINTQDEWVIKPQKQPIHLVNPEKFVFTEGATLFLHDVKGNVIYFTDNPVMIYSDYILERMPNGEEKHTDFDGRTIETTQSIFAGAEEVFHESEGMIGIRKDRKYGFVDLKGRLLIANRYDSIGEFHEGLAPVFLVGKWGYLNKHDEIVIQPTYDKVTSFKNHLAVVKRAGLAGLVDANGREVLELRYDSIRRLPDNHFIICSGNLKGLADADGRIMIEPRFDSMVPLPERRVVVSMANKYGLLTYGGLNVLPTHFAGLEYISGPNCFLVKEEPEISTIRLK